MKPARIILLVVALVAGGLAAFLVTRGGRPAPQTQTVTQVVEEAKTQILVAKTPIGIGERLGALTVEWVDWPEGALRADYVTISAMPDAPAELTGAVARYEFFPGEPIREAKLVRADQGYLSAVLSEGMRGVSVGVSAVSSAGGFVIPNDHVDVILTTQTAAGEQSEVILANVRVLAIGKRIGEVGVSGGQTPENVEAGARPQPITFDRSTIATLELDPAQAETLINASTKGQLTLTLRSVVDFGKGSTLAERSSNQTVRVFRAGQEQAVMAGSNGQISFAYGTFRQSAKNQYVRINNNLGSEKASHYILNYQHIENNRTFRIEGYYKKYDQLVKYVNGDQYDLNNAGSGFAKGMELFWRDNRSIENVDYWISYSYLDTQRDYLNFPYKATPSFASSHNISLVYKHFVQRLKSQLGTTYSFTTGRPYNNPNESVFNNSTTSSYQDLSFNWSYLPKPYLIVYVSCTNVLGRNNVFGYEYSENKNAEGLYNGRAIRQAANRFIFFGVFITLSKDKSMNQLPTL